MIYLETYEEWSWEWFKSQSPIVIAILATGIIMFYVLRYFFNLNHRFKKTEADCNKIEPHYSELTAAIKNIATDIAKILIYLKQKDTNLDTGLFTHRSPIELSPIGLKLLSDSGGREYVDKNVDFLVSALESKGLISALDVQTQAISVISDQNASLGFKKIKDYVYQNPTYTYENNELPLTMITINNIMGVYLRDKYFERHPDLRNIEPSFQTPEH